MKLEIIVLGLITTPTESLIQPIKADSRMLAHAMQNIINRFYSKHSSTVFILEGCNQALQSKELLGELTLIGSDRVSITYVIENNVTTNPEILLRHFNIFVVDSYESFK